MTDAPIVLILALAALIALGAGVWGLALLVGRARETGLTVLQRDIESVRAESRRARMRRWPPCTRTSRASAGRSASGWDSSRAWSRWSSSR